MATPKVMGHIESEGGLVKVSMYRDRSGELYIEITDMSEEPLYIDVNEHSVFADKNGYSAGTWNKRMKGEDW